jgi:two-component sensor histidine kinase
VGFPAEFNLDNAQSLGLSLTQTMIGNLNGKMECELYQGSRFTVEFKEYRECGKEDL